jgi:SpoVK/Ycf46/Vps4 family AAA+-type ATPase
MQEELRRAAAQAFRESLDQLESRLGSNDEQCPPTSRTESSASEASRFTLSDFEAAVADIEKHAHRH